MSSLKRTASLLAARDALDYKKPRFSPPISPIKRSGSMQMLFKRDSMPDLRSYELTLPADDEKCSPSSYTVKEIALPTALEEALQKGSVFDRSTDHDLTALEESFERRKSQIYSHLTDSDTSDDTDVYEEESDSEQLPEHSNNNLENTPALTLAAWRASGATCRPWKEMLSRPVALITGKERLVLSVNNKNDYFAATKDIMSRAAKLLAQILCVSVPEIDLPGQLSAFSNDWIQWHAGTIALTEFMDGIMTVHEQLACFPNAASIQTFAKTLQSIDPEISKSVTVESIMTDVEAARTVALDALDRMRATYNMLESSWINKYTLIECTYQLLAADINLTLAYHKKAAKSAETNEKKLLHDKQVNLLKDFKRNFILLRRADARRNERTEWQCQSVARVLEGMFNRTLVFRDQD